MGRNSTFQIQVHWPSRAAERSAHPLCTADTGNHSVLLRQAIIVCCRGTHNSRRKQPAPFRSGKGAVAGRAACLMFEAVKKTSTYNPRNASRSGTPLWGLFEKQTYNSGSLATAAFNKADCWKRRNYRQE